MNTKLNNTIRTCQTIASIFIAWNVVFFIIALIMKNHVAADTQGVLLFRGGFYAIGGVILHILLRSMLQGKRGGWLRQAIITVLAPLGVIAFIAFTPHLPLWFDIGQIGSALLLAAIAAMIYKKDVRQAFPKKPKA